jgi:hypothetical protein
MFRKVLIVVFLTPLVAFTTYAQSEDRSRDPNQPQPLQTTETTDNTLGLVLDLERPSDTDVLLLRNGDKLTGTILNESFSIRTSYATIKYSNRMIAGIDLEGGTNNIEAIVTVNNNRFSGFIDDSAFVFKLQTGPQIQIRREKILKAIFRVREKERKGIPQRQFFILKNGDYFSGKIMNDQLILSTTYAKVPLNLNDAVFVKLIGVNNPLTKVLMRNHDTVQGVLDTEDILVQLDVGPTVKIYQDRIEVFHCIDGYVPPEFSHITSVQDSTQGSTSENTDALLNSSIRYVIVNGGVEAFEAGTKRTLWSHGPWWFSQPPQSLKCDGKTLCVDCGRVRYFLNAVTGEIEEITE